MKFFDKRRKWWIARWLHHFWVLSFNRNPALYRVVWWSRWTRPIFYNTKGHMRGYGGDGVFLSFFLPASIVFCILFLWLG